LNFTFAFQMYINRSKVSITIFILQRSYQRQCHKRTRIGSRNSGQEITKFPQDFQVIYLQNLNISQGGDAWNTENRARLEKNKMCSSPEEETTYKACCNPNTQNILSSKSNSNRKSSLWIMYVLNVNKLLFRSLRTELHTLLCVLSRRNRGKQPWNKHSKSSKKLQ